MLRVTGFKEGSRANVEFGEYIIVEVGFEGERHPSAPLYWRTGDFVGSLVEVGINRVSGAVAKVGLVAFNNPELLVDDRKYLTQSSVAGIPVFDISGWPDSRYKDEIGYLKVAESELMFLIFFTPAGKVELVYESSGVRFGVCSEGELAWVVIMKQGKG